MSSDDPHQDSEKTEVQKADGAGLPMPDLNDVGSESEFLKIIFQDQRARWMRGSPMLVDEYLRKIPRLLEIADIRIRLAVAEFYLQRSYGKQQTIDQFLARYPEISFQLSSELLDGATRLYDGPVIDDPTISVQTGSELRSRFGRYRVVRLLGEGAFGRVYLGYDDQLQRPVAIKVPSPKQFQEPGQIASFLKEARMAAGLNHPNIVTVHDFGETEDGAVFVVAHYVEGQTLREYLSMAPMSHEEAVRIIVAVADGLQHAHEHHVIHRDVKPGNILIEEKSGKVFITDFGLAVHSHRAEFSSEFAGTPGYMSPEQARCESHRVDARSDIFSLGSVFYLLLTGHRAFGGSNVGDLIQQVIAAEPRPPREVKPDIPEVLERICQKAMSKKASDRFPSAKAMAEALQTWQEKWKPQQFGLRIVPRGLRAFQATDAQYFPELLPGPLNQDGLPEAIAFWKERLEDPDPDNRFSVGMLCGPSGSGKTSLIRAGVIPSLSATLRTIYLECSPNNTEQHLLKALLRLFPEIQDAESLVDVLVRIRLDGAKRVIIFLDQFEQWLYSHAADGTSELERVLRQCDGSVLQSVIMIRDEFALSAARFMDSLDIPLAQGKNFRIAELFSRHHAVTVLTRFGQAFEKLPLPPGEPTTEQTAFLEEVVSGLSHDGRVAPVQLALFAEMVKDRSWTLGTLQELGGLKGIGITFLDECFTARRAGPKGVQHQKAASRVLDRLLPEPGTDLRTHSCQRSELKQASGYDDERQFEDLIRLLEVELRLVSLVESEPGNAATAGKAGYQLAHDYLVPVLREWLNRRQSETREGRAEIKLRERTSLWSRRPEQQQLPSLLEWTSILRHTNRRNWSKSSHDMMSMANRYYGTRILITTTMLLMAVSLFAAGRYQAAVRQRELMVAGYVEDLWRAQDGDAIAFIDQLEPYRREWESRVRTIADSEETSPTVRTRAQLALVRQDPSLLSDLLKRSLVCGASEHRMICDGIVRHKEEVIKSVHQRLQDTPLQPNELTSLAGMLAQFSPEDPEWEILAPRLASALVDDDPLQLQLWIEELRPVQNRLRDPLINLCVDTEESDNRCVLAARILSEFQKSDAAFLSREQITQLALGTNELVRDILDPLLREYQADLLSSVNAMLRTPLPDPSSQVSPHELPIRQEAILCACRLGQTRDLWTALDNVEDPRLRSLMIDAFVDLKLSFEELRNVLPTLKPTSRQAVILGLSRRLERKPDLDRTGSLELFTGLVKTDPDSGVHSAAEYAIRTHASAEQARQILGGLRNTGCGNWRVLPNGLCMITIVPPADSDVSLSGRKFEISATEVTVEQFEEYTKDVEPSRTVTTQPQCPMSNLNVFHAMRYCRWLTEQDPEMPQERQVYPPVHQLGEELLLAPDYLTWPGFRLPTQREWEYCTRAGSETSRFFGESDEHLSQYAWWVENAKQSLWPVGTRRPNAWGLFDTYGNVAEWCHPSEGFFDNTAQIVKGGEYRAIQRFLNTTYETKTRSDTRLSTIGFRIVRVPP